MSTAPPNFVAPHRELPLELLSRPSCSSNSVVSIRRLSITGLMAIIPAALVLKQPDLKSNQEYEGGGATVQGSGGTGPSMAGGTLPASGVSGGSAGLSNRDSNPMYRGSREPRIID